MTISVDRMKPAPREHEGVPVYLKYSDIERELAQHPKEAKAVELAKTGHWRRALETLYDANMVTYSTDPRRLKFLDVVPLSKDMTVLEIGVGFGQHSAAIAKRVKHLDTFEIRLVNAVFAKIRCEQEGIVNATFSCGGDDCRLPFPDNAYDAVVFNLVLEWCGSSNPEEPATVSHRRLLGEIHRVLKPGGLFQLSTKNRFAYRLLTGGGDEHAYEMRFGNALPRWLMMLLLRLRKKQRPEGYLHSYRALSKLLQDVGLVPVRAFWAVPEMRFPEHLVAADAASIRAARRQLKRQGESRRTDLLMRFTPACLVRHFAPGLFFIARKRA